MYKNNAVPVPFDRAYPGSVEARSSSLASVVTEIYLASSNMSVDSVADELVSARLGVRTTCSYVSGCLEALAQLQLLKKQVSQLRSGFWLSCALCSACVCLQHNCLTISDHYEGR